MSKRPSKRKTTLHTTLSEKALHLLEKYLSPALKNNEITYNSRAEIIEHALELLDKYYNPELEDRIMLWRACREALDMVAVGKTTFLAYISGDTTRAFKENIAIEIIEWYKKKKLSDLTLEEVLRAIKEIWIAANYFTNVEIEIGSQGNYQVQFYHNLRNQRYGEFWGQYFAEFLRNHKQCKTEVFLRNESFLLLLSR